MQSTGWKTTMLKLIRLVHWDGFSIAEAGRDSPDPLLHGPGSLVVLMMIDVGSKNGHA